MPGYIQSDNERSPDAKLAVVIETATMAKTKPDAYDREKCLYPEQIQQWKSGLPSRRWQARRSGKAAQKQRKDDLKTIKQLKAEVRRKDKVLAETTSLLVLSKKLEALYGEDLDSGEDD